MRNILLLLSITMIFVLSIGCSQSSSPVLPEGGSQKIPMVGALPVGVTDILPDGTPSGGMGTLGLFELRINPSTSEAELNSLRSSTLADVLETVDISNFLQMAPCTKCVKIKSVSLNSDGNIVVSIGIKHPFAAGDIYKPITGRNRADLHVFNIEGIVISDIPGTTFPTVGESVAGFKLPNADGYTGYLDASIDEFFPTEASIHPYILHFNDYSAGNFDPGNPMGFLSVTDPPPSGNLVMAMGCDYNYQDYVFDIDPATPVSFIYAVGCTYGLSAATKSLRFQPEYRIPQHNKKAASEVNVAIVNNDLRGEDPTTTAGIEIRVVDISHGVAVGDELDKMFSDSSVDSLMIDIPGIMATPLTLNGSSSVSGTGHDPSDPLLYTATITNASSAAEGSYTGIVKVRDTYAPGQNGAPTLQSMDGIKRVDPLQTPLTGLFAIDEFATYQAFTVDVAPGNDPPTAILITNPDPANINEYQSVDFDATTSSDPDGTITLYEFDFDWDSVEANFVADVSNSTGLENKQFTTAGTYIIGLRVTDNLGATAYDSAPVNVEAGCMIHVDGNNVSGPWDGTPAHPFLHVQDAVDVSPDDCMIYIHSGTVTEVQAATNEASEITITNKTNLTIQGENMPKVRMARAWNLQTGKAAIHAFTCNGLTVKGIELTPYYAYQSGVWLENSSNCTIEGCKVTPTPENGFLEFVRASNCPGLVVKSNILDGFETVSTYMSLMVISNSNNTVITLNRGLNAPISGGYNMNQTGEGFISVYNSSGVEVSKNTFGVHHRSVPSAIYVQLQSIYVSGGANNVVRNNLMYDIYFYDNGAGVSNNYGIIASGSTNIKIFNNTIDLFGINNAGGGVTYGIQLVGTSGAELYNNIVSNLKATQSGTCYGVASDVAIAQTYSDVWNLIGATTYRYSGLATEGAGSLNTNPIFVNPAIADYHLQSGSPCKGTGQGGADMGCYGGSDPLP